MRQSLTGADVNHPEKAAAFGSWGRARRWGIRALTAVAALVIVLDNFVLVEVRVPGWHQELRLGWLLVAVAAVAFWAGRHTSRR